MQQKREKELVVTYRYWTEPREKALHDTLLPTCFRHWVVM